MGACIGIGETAGAGDGIGMGIGAEADGLIAGGAPAGATAVPRIVALVCPGAIFPCQSN
jgi:hypothetical protein